MLDVLREEKKYGISLERAQGLFFKLSQAMDGDPFNGLNSYLVRSLYFDSINDDDFFEKGEGIQNSRRRRTLL